LAAARLGLPLVLLEQNAVVGRANRALARWADALCLSFDACESTLRLDKIAPRCRIHATGTPVRDIFAQVASYARTASPAPCQPSTDAPKHSGNDHALPNDRKPLLLVLGGSGGARLLNQSVPPAVGRLRAELAGWRIVHQTGPADVAMTQAAYRAAGAEASVVTFVDDLAALLSQTSLAICRAGGSTLAELAALRVPAILVPLAEALDDHQRQNAVSFSNKGAVHVIEAATKELLTERLTPAARQLVCDGARRAALARGMEQLARPEAARRVTEIVLRLAQFSRHPNYQSSPVFPSPPLCIDSRAA
jgi:UDP-N-acetylglucosamine--N-acetylmuramyl-(pentapeptide) pyrophosphoryl-undecaprenol N-acetylglucosamine transferase